MEVVDHTKDNKIFRFFKLSTTIVIPICSFSMDSVSATSFTTRTFLVSQIPEMGVEPLSSTSNVSVDGVAIYAKVKI